MGKPCGCSGAVQRAPQPPRPPQPDTRVASAAPVSSAAKVYYEIWRNGKFTGRRSESLVSAQATATRLGGEVRPSR